MARQRYTGVTKDPKTGKYMYYFKAGVDMATGKPYQERRRGFNTAKEAHEARTLSMSKIHKKGRIKYTQMTFKEFLDIIFIPDYYSAKVDDIEKRESAIFRELVERFGNKKPREITVFDVTLYKNELIDRHASTYAKRKMVLLGQILKSAQCHGLIFHELVTDKVSPISITKPEIDFWTKSEFEQFIFSLDRSSYFEHFIFTLIWFYYFTGVRVNEATALYWEDIDFEKKVVSIGHNLKYVNRQNWKRSSKLKTESSKRVIGLDDTTLQLLISWQERQATHSKIDFVFSPNGYPYPKRSIRDQIIKYAERSGVKAIQPKGLRHSHASLLINEYNLNALLVQKRLGHSDVKTTLSVYSHLYPNADEEVTSKLGTLFEPKIPKQATKSSFKF